MKKESLFVFGLLLLFAVSIKAEDKNDRVESSKIKVYRSPTCSCCSKWVGHLKQNGFIVEDFVTENMDEVKRNYGISKEVASCHTALINGYVVEGHVPALDIRKLLKIKPVATGVSVPGMPVGTPGMEMGNKRDSYNVVLFAEGKKNQVFSKYDYAK